MRKKSVEIYFDPGFRQNGKLKPGLRKCIQVKPAARHRFSPAFSQRARQQTTAGEACQAAAMEVSHSMARAVVSRYTGLAQGGAEHGSEDYG
jgi:hypothetical protein